MKKIINTILFTSLMTIASCAHWHQGCGDQCAMKKESCKECKGQCDMKHDMKHEMKAEESKETPKK
jgi:hypothetical protein